MILGDGLLKLLQLKDLRRTIPLVDHGSHAGHAERVAYSTVSPIGFSLQTASLRS
jgi:hypothetical protein